MAENEANLRKELGAALEGLFILRGIKPATEPEALKLIQVWLEDLMDLGYENAIEAIRRFRREGTEYATPAAVRRYAPGGVGLSIEERSAFAWGLFRSSLQAFGYDSGYDFEDTAINAAARALGGLSRLGQMTSADMGFHQKLFRTAYEGAFRCGVGDHRPLLGSDGNRRFIPQQAANQLDNLRVLCAAHGERQTPALLSEVSRGEEERQHAVTEADGRRGLSAPDSGSRQAGRRKVPAGDGGL